MTSIGFRTHLYTLLTKNIELFAPRDAMMKLVHNTGLFLSGATKCKNEEASQKLKKMAKNLVSIRAPFSAFNLFRDYATFKKYISMKNLTPSPSNKFVTILNYASLLSDSVTIITNNLDYLTECEVLNKNKFSDKYGTISCSFWVASILIGIALKKHELNSLPPTNKAKDKDKLKKKILNIQIFSLICDLPISLSGTGLPIKLVGKTFSDTTKGITGITAAVSNLYAFKLNEKL